MQKGLVSIITPCYNTGSIVHRLLDSILQQNYSNIEMFIVNDGSTDNTAEVISLYVPLFEKKGYKLNIINQPNQGQSAAVNNALKLVNGEYLIWPDSDDFYRSNDAIATLIAALINQTSDFAAVRCIPTYVDEDTLQDKKSIHTDKIYYEYNQFLNCLYSEKFIWGAGNYIVRMDAFDKVNPERTIYVEKNAGQNWQMLLPLLYSYKCLTLDKSYFNVLVRSASHSRGQYKTFEQVESKFQSYENTIVETLNSMKLMPEEDRLNCIHDIQKKYVLEQLKNAIEHGNKLGINKYLSKAEKSGAIINSRLRWSARFASNICMFKICKLTYPIVRLLYRIINK